MHFAKSLLGLLIASAGVAHAAYSIVDNFQANNFFENFNFFDSADPTQGSVKYVSMTTANSTSLAGLKNGAVFLGVDSTTLNPVSPGRPAVRVQSNKTYTHGLFIADISHMPEGCGTWPAFWTTAANPSWPADGEIDALEGVNSNTKNQATLHTSAGCTLENTVPANISTLGTDNCNAGNPAATTGCSASFTDPASFGAPFNAAGGGVYAIQWTSTNIAVYHFPRSAIPADILSSSATPDPSTWGTPSANFAGSGCAIDKFFKEHYIIFNTSLCGSWAGATDVWKNDATCSKLADTCEAYVAQNPGAFANAYWAINSVKVYQDGSSKPAARRSVAARAFTA